MAPTSGQARKGAWTIGRAQLDLGGDKLAAVDLQRHAAHRVHGNLARVVDLVDLLDFDDSGHQRNNAAMGFNGGVLPAGRHRPGR